MKISLCLFLLLGCLCFSDLSAQTPSKQKRSLVHTNTSIPIDKNLILTKEVTIQNPQYLAMLQSEEAIQNFETKLTANKYVANVELNTSNKTLQICFQEVLVTDLIGNKDISDERKNKIVNEFMDDFVSVYTDQPLSTTGASSTPSGVRNIEMMMGFKNITPVIDENIDPIDGITVKTLSKDFFDALPTITQQKVLESSYYIVEN